MMEHSNEQNLYTERYLGGDMSAEERAAFEEHFFNCQFCGDDVAAAGRMFAAGHDLAVIEENDKLRKLGTKNGWRRWFPQAAAAAIISAFGTWMAIVPRIPAPVAVVSGEFHELPTEAVRSGETASPRQYRNGDTLLVPMPIFEEPAGYRYDLRDAKGKSYLAADVSPQQKSVTIQLRELPRGSYEVVIEGVRKDGNRFPITRVPFEVIGER